MNRFHNRRAYYIGLLFLATGIFLNKWLIAFVIARDGQIESRLCSSAILLFQLAAMALGVFLIIKKPRLPHLPKREMILLAASGFVSLLFLEIGARLWLRLFATPEQYFKYALFTDIPPQQYQWTRHPYLNYYPTPNYMKGATSHNRLGYRNNDVLIPKPAGVYRIVILGGSAVYTIRVEANGKTFPAQLERLLRETYGYPQVEVINAGAGGYTSWESLLNLELRVLDLEPDLVIVYHGVNDVHARLVAPEAYRGDNSGYRKPWDAPRVLPFEHSCLLRILTRASGLLQQVHLNMFVTAATYRGPGSKHPAPDQMALLKQNPPIYFRRNLINMVTIAKAQHIKIMLASWAYSSLFQNELTSAAYQYGIQEHRAVTAEVARSQDILFFDFAAVMPQEKQYWADESHVNEQGALLKAELFAKFIHAAGLIAD